MGKPESDSRTTGASGTDYVSYPMFKGLQRPLEFMGVQGRYIYWAAATAGSGVLCFILGYCLVGFLVGLAALVVLLAAGALLILVKQRKGLHSKNTDKGIFIFAGLRQL